MFSVDRFVLFFRRQQPPLQEIVLELEHRPRAPVARRDPLEAVRRPAARRALTRGRLRATEHGRKDDQHEQGEEQPDGLSHGGDDRLS